MDKHKLSQLKHLKREIELLQEQINKIEPITTTDSVKGSEPEFPYVQHTIKIQGIDWQNYDRRALRLRRKLERKIGELMDAVEEMNEYIDTVEDSEMRQILTLRYINGLTWQQIAKDLGYQDESAPRKKHDRFLNDR